jgi:hypothetical protein
MREADVGSPSADPGRAISDHPISRPGLIWRRGSQSLMGNFGGSNRSSRWHWHQPRKGRCSDTDDHLLTCQQGFLGIFCAAWKSEIAKKPTSPRCFKIRRVTKIYHQYARPADRADISNVRMPVRHQNLDIRENVRPPRSGCPRGPVVPSNLAGAMSLV